ncbi:MAG: CHRD domain-containing protein [Rhodospirillales bacterium]|nr:CHRD domain-containing protein [Rhodospirillales bacterium]
MTRLALTAFAAGLLFSTSAFAATETFHATLTGAQQVPPVHTSATGSATVTIDTATKKATWTVTYSGLKPFAAHIHGPAPVGKNAGVMVPMKVGPSPMTGSATLTAQQIKTIEAGDAYVNLHTAAHKGGELRGQLTK